jgi:hypothetical protein
MGIANTHPPKMHSPDPRIPETPNQATQAYRFSNCQNKIKASPMKHFPTITVNPGQMGGGRTESQIFTDYPDLTLEDIRACLHFAAATVM